MKPNSPLGNSAGFGSLHLAGVALVFVLFAISGTFLVSGADAPARPTLKELKPVLEKAAAEVFGAVGKVQLTKVDVIEIGASGWAPLTGITNEDVFWPVKAKCTLATSGQSTGEQWTLLFRVFHTDAGWQGDTKEVYTETAVRSLFKSREAVRKQACIANLRQLDGAKAMWALENRKGDTDTPTMADLKGQYLRATVTCPDGGTYILNSMDKPPVCSIPGHVLP